MTSEPVDDLINALGAPDLELREPGEQTQAERILAALPPISGACSAADVVRRTGPGVTTQILNDLARSPHSPVRRARAGKGFRYWRAEG